MKRLYLLRHSKAGHTNKKILDDHERTLTEKGEAYCSDIAHFLLRHHSLPQYVLCSTATRCKQTLELLLAEAGTSVPTTHNHNLYLAPPSGLLKAVQDADENLSSLMIVGHNPGLQEFAIMLAGSGDKKKFRALRSAFPPPSIAVFDIPVEHWFQVEERSAELIDFYSAKKPD